MAELFVSHDESLMPLVMGSPYRVPDYAYPNWGLPPHTDESTANAVYQAEWAGGTSEQLALVSKAIVRVGFGDFPEMLRRKTGQVVSRITESHNNPVPKSLTILDIGAGPGLSALAIYQALPTEIQRRTTMLLLDPSSESLQFASKLMAAHGINSRVATDIDSNLLGYTGSNSVDIMTAVASIHHHAKIPFEEYYQALKPGGCLVVADWHQPLWEHPGYVFDFLETFDWPEKSAGLSNWIETYPQSREARHLYRRDRLTLTGHAIKQITGFWHAYKEIADNANLGPNAIWPLEGHRPVKRYVRSLQEAGFILSSPLIVGLINRGAIDTNPHQLLRNSNLLMVTVAQKPVK